jgi:hypothetical protein
MLGATRSAAISASTAVPSGPRGTDPERGLAQHLHVVRSLAQGDHVFRAKIPNVGTFGLDLATGRNAHHAELSVRILRAAAAAIIASGGCRATGGRRHASE